MDTITMKDAHAELSQYRNINYQSFSSLVGGLVQKRVVHREGKGLLNLAQWRAYVDDIAERKKIKNPEWLPPGFY